MNEQTQKWYGIAGGIIIIFIAAAWYFAHWHTAAAPGVTGTTATTTLATSTGTTSNSNGNVQLGGVVDSSTLAKPNLDRPYTPLSSLPQSVQDANKKLYATAVAQLKFDPNGIAYWLQLAQLRKGANDFTGAEEVWLYVTKRWPKDPIAYNNLADMYENYSHDYAKATTYWNALITLAPTNISAYLNLATMQDINLKDTSSAKATLQAGIKANPDSVDLKNALAALQ